MSLLNQVLQDLEKNNALSNEDKHTTSDQIKVPPQKKRNYLFLSIVLPLLFITLSIVTYQYSLHADSALRLDEPKIGQTVILLEPEPTTEQTTQIIPFEIEQSNDPKIEASHVGISRTDVHHDKTQQLKVSQIDIPHDVTPQTETLAIENNKTPPNVEPVSTSLLPPQKPSTKIDVQKEKSITRPSPKKEKLKPIVNTKTELNTKTLAISGKKKISKITTVTPKQQADRLFLHSKQSPTLLNKQKLLQQALVLNYQHIDAHLLLAKTYLQQGLVNDAVTSLKRSLTILPKNIELTTALASLLLKNKQSENALDILLNIKSSTANNEQYLNLLAAAYQQNKHTIKAGETYRLLLEFNLEKSEYWLGLAISLDEQKRYSDSLTAYKKVLNLNSLKPAVIRYVKQRISLIN
ncbi:MAG: hypothetical protein HRT92_02535 [Piscirickettsiaceae bacterium]|nr:hypothetical protein [Piscirickettsiaceae bacterium]